MLNLFKKSTLKTIDKVSLDKEIQEFTQNGTTGDDDGLIISLTSFPQRMYEIHYTLYSLLTQTVKPAKVICGSDVNSFQILKRIYLKKF